MQSSMQSASSALHFRDILLFRSSMKPCRTQLRWHVIHLRTFYSPKTRSIFRAFHRAFLCNRIVLLAIGFFGLQGLQLALPIILLTKPFLFVLGWQGRCSLIVSRKAQKKPPARFCIGPSCFYAVNTFDKLHNHAVQRFITKVE